MTPKERLKTVGCFLAKCMTACAGVLRGKVRLRQPRVAPTTPEVPSVASATPVIARPAPRFARKYVILAAATAIVGICAIALIRKGPPIAVLRAKAATLFSRKKSHAQPPASKLAQAPAPKAGEAHEAKPAEAHEAKPAEAHEAKPAEAPAPRRVEPATPKLAETPPQKLAANSLVSERMVRSCESLAKPRLAAESSTGADVYAVAVCKQFGLWKQAQPALQRSD